MLTVFHLVALDLNIYWEQLSEQAYREAQLRWLELDLSAANRNRQAVPWIVVMGHIPLVSWTKAPNPPSLTAKLTPSLLAAAAVLRSLLTGERNYQLPAGWRLVGAARARAASPATRRRRKIAILSRFACCPSR